MWKLSAAVLALALFCASAEASICLREPTNNYKSALQTNNEVFGNLDDVLESRKNANTQLQADIPVQRAEVADEVAALTASTSEQLLELETNGRAIFDQIMALYGETVEEFSKEVEEFQHCAGNNFDHCEYSILINSQETFAATTDDLIARINAQVSNGDSYNDNIESLRTLQATAEVLDSQEIGAGFAISAANIFQPVLQERLATISELLPFVNSFRPLC